MSSTIIAELARQIAARRLIYDRAFEGDVGALRKVHGEGPIADALQLLEQQHKRSGKRKRRRADDSTRHYWLEGRMPTRGWLASE